MGTKNELSNNSTANNPKMKDKGKAKVFNDDKVFICLDDDDDNDAELNAAIKASLLDSSPNPNSPNNAPIIDLEADDDDAKSMPTTSSIPPFTRTRSHPPIVEIGESSSPSTPKNKRRLIEEVNRNPSPLAQLVACDICTDSKPVYQFFKVKGCAHSYCYDCVKNYVSSKLEGGVTKISCPVPSCPGTLDPEYCKDVIPQEIFSKWGKQLCEAVILAEQKFFCPFKECSALLVDDAGETVMRAECPYCNRLFCAKCRAVWHEGVGCTEYQMLKEDERDDGDLKLRNLAKASGWDRCPRCGFYVEKIDGCSSVSCRNCQHTFCYGSGALYNAQSLQWNYSRTNQELSINRAFENFASLPTNNPNRISRMIPRGFLRTYGNGVSPNFLAQKHANYFYDESFQSLRNLQLDLTQRRRMDYRNVAWQNLAPPLDDPYGD